MIARTLQLLFVSSVLTVGIAGSAEAIDIRNLDAVKYDVKVTSSSMVKRVPVAARSMSIIICVGSCQFDIPGVGRLKASGSDVITVKGGQLTRTGAPVASQPTPTKPSRQRRDRRRRTATRT